MKTKIRTAILGYGRSGSTMHAEAIGQNAAFEMRAVCDIDPERQRQATQRFGCQIYSDYHTMLRQEPLDLVTIVTRSDQHCTMTCDCLAAGVPVLVTKPWAVNAAEAERMIAASRAAGKRLLPWLPSRWGCILRRLRELIAAQTIGKIFLIRRAVSSFGTRCDWQTEKRYGGGYLLNWGPHIIDPAVLLAGGKVRSAYAVLRQVLNPGDAEDLFLAVLTLTDGATVLAEYTVATESMPDWFIQGDRGTIVVRDNHLKICKHIPARPQDPTQFTTMQSDGSETIEETVKGQPYGNEHEIYADVARALRGEQEFPVTPADALDFSRVLDAIRTAGEQNRVVMLE